MEIWKPIENYEGNYWVSDCGNIKNRHNQIKSVRDNLRGYLICDLYKDGSRKTCSVARLVGKAFIEPKNEKFVEIDHIDNDKYNNFVENLRWIDKSGNNRNKQSVRNKHGFIGVYLRRNKYLAQIRVDKKKKHLGTYDTPAEAHEAYMNEYNKIMSIY